MGLAFSAGLPTRCALADWMRIPGLLRRPIAAAAVFTVFVVVVWAPAWAQGPAPASPETTWEMMGADSEVRPRFQGYLLDTGDVTIYDPFNEIVAKVSAAYPCWNDVAPRRSLQPFELPWCCGPVLA